MKHSFYALCFCVCSAIIFTSCSKSTEDLSDPNKTDNSVSSQTTGVGNYTFFTELFGFRVVPTNSSIGKGTFTLQYTSNGKTGNYELTWARIEPLSAHIHLGSPTENGPVVVDLGQPLSSPYKGTIEITDEMASQLLSGKLYVDIHTRIFPDGEIRGQVGKQ
jgi:hypothetical protein